MRIDVHTHIFPDEMATTVVPKLAQIAGIRESLDGRCSSLLRSMDACGIDVSCLLPVATKPSQVDPINAHMNQVRSERLITFGAFHPDCRNIPELIEQMKDQGFVGVKIHPEYQNVSPIDAKLFPLYESLIQENMIVLFHAGVDIGVPTINSTPQQFVQLRQMFPELIMILAHLGGFQQWNDVETHLVGEDVILDTSYCFDFISDEQFLRIVRNHGCDKIVFGTDSPWADQQSALAKLRSLPLTEHELDLITGENCARLLLH